MCGIVGVLGNVTPEAFDVFEVMLSVDMLRGKDSTGVAAIAHNKEANIVKDVFWPLELMRTDDYAENIESKQKTAQCLIGHNRAATKGVVNKRNAHPYQYGSIIGVHNGTLREDLSPDSRVFDVDSKSIFYSINKKGVDWTWKNLKGAATLVWFDLTHNTLNILSNTQRPFFWGFSKDNSQMFFSSEDWVYKTACHRAGIKLQKTFWKPKDDILISYTYDKKKKKIVQKEGRKLAPFTYHSANNNTRSSFQNGNYSNVNNSGQVRNLTEEREKREAKQAQQIASHLKGSVPNIGNKINTKGNVICFPDQDISYDVFKQRYDHCCFCYGDLSFANFVALDDKTAACKDCTDTTSLKEVRKWSTNGWTDGDVDAAIASAFASQAEDAAEMAAEISKGGKKK